MNVYYHLTTKELVTIIRVCKASKYSIQEKYDQLPITKNTVRDYTLWTSRVDEYTVQPLNSRHTYVSNTKIIQSSQITTTLKRSLHTIQVNFDYLPFYNIEWFQNIKRIKLHCTSPTAPPFSPITVNTFNSIMSQNSASDVSCDMPLFYFSFYGGLKFPKEMKTLTLRMNEQHWYQYLLQNNVFLNQHTNRSSIYLAQNLSDLVIIGNTESNWLQLYLQHFILKPNSVLNSLTLKNINRSNLTLKNIPSHDLLIKCSTIWSWQDIIKWVFYQKDDTSIPKKIQLVCLVHSLMAWNIYERHLKAPTGCISPLEELKMYSPPQAVVTTASLVVWLELLKKVASANIFPKLKLISLTVFDVSVSEESQKNIKHELIINGVSVIVNEVYSTSHEMSRLLDSEFE